MIDNTLRGIDASVYQESIEWSKVAKAGIRFAMLKATQGHSVTRPNLYLFRDSTFCTNVRGASAAGILCGAYHYLTAKTTEEAEREATYFLSVIEPYKALLPLGAAVDVEDSTLPRDRDTLTAIVHAFCAVLTRSGITPMVYTNPDFLRHRLGDVSRYGLWLALWRNPAIPPTEAQYPNLRIWQWGRTRVDGISAPCDANLAVAGLLTDAETEAEPDYAAEVCRRAGLSDTTRDYLSAYRWSDDLYRKLYNAMQ